MRKGKSKTKATLGQGNGTDIEFAYEHQAMGQRQTYATGQNPCACSELMSSTQPEGFGKRHVILGLTPK